jgi:hypothetical protein
LNDAKLTCRSEATPFEVGGTEDEVNIPVATCP